MAISTPVTQALDRLGLSYRLFQHSHLPESLEQAARERGQLPEQVIRSLLFRTGKNGFCLVLTAGPGQISWRALRAQLGVSRISMATEQEVLEVTGSPIGAVGPLGLPVPIRLLADEGVFQSEEISIGSGVRGTAVILKSADLRCALGTVDIAHLS